MNVNKKELIGILVAIVLMIIMGFVTIYLGNSLAGNDSGKINTAGNLTAGNIASNEVVIWYYDSSFSEYLNLCSDEYYKENGVKINPVLVDEENYLENINQSNINGNDRPDVYIMNSTMLEKAVLGGLTRENKSDDIFNEDIYSKTGISAATYKGRLQAYPMNFDTSFVLYNKELVADAPATFDDIINYSNTMDETISGKIENVLIWNVQSLLYNYGFVGEYLEYGGKNGDDATVKNLNNEKMLVAMTYYKNLNQIFAIDINTTYPTVVDKFIQGKASYVIAKTDMISAIESNDNNIDYGVGLYPDINPDLKCKSLAVTNVAAVNPYGNNEAKSADVAEFISYKMADMMYESTGKLSARVDVEYDNEQLYMVLAQYAKAVNLPKLMEAGDFGAKLEVVFNSIWQGGDVPTILATLQ